MLKEFIGAAELRTALSLTANDNSLLVVHCAIQKAMHQSSLRVFAYPFDQPVFWFFMDVVKNSRSVGLQLDSRDICCYYS